MSSSLACRICQSPLAATVAGTVACPRCGPLQWTWLGPAFLVPAQVRTGARAQEGEGTCFFHATRRAERACEACGRFVCALCDMPVGKAHLCPACLEEGRSPQAQTVKDRSRWRMDKLLFSICIFSIIPPFILLSFLTAPYLVFQSLRHWNKSPGLLAVGKVGARARLVFVLVLALVQLSVWLWLLGRLILTMVA